ncbi:MAG: Spy/CpxP family protein refolding chaperone [Spirochaetes bacterium]|nr:Spy/CpxP family protein refolding chaperone [Spirochaetota bacterium]
MKKIQHLSIFMLVIFLAVNLSAKMDKDHGPGMGPGHEPGMMPDSMGWWHNENIITELALTDEQIEKIEKIKTDTQKEMIKTGAVVAEKMLDLKEEMRKEKLNESAINKLINEIADKRNQMFKIRMKSKLEGLKLLTPEQRKKLHKMLFRNPKGRKKGTEKKKK